MEMFLADKLDSDIKHKNAVIVGIIFKFILYSVFVIFQRFQSRILFYFAG